MFCKNCGHDIVEGLICPNCGMENVQEVVSEVSEIKTPAKIWDVFARVGYGLGIATFVASFATMGFMLFYSIVALVISCLGKKSIDYKKEATKGFKLSLTSIILSVLFICFVICAIVVCFVLMTLGIITSAGVIAIIAIVFNAI